MSEACKLSEVELRKRKKIEDIWRKVRNAPANVELVGSPQDWAFWEKLLDAQEA